MDSTKRTPSDTNPENSDFVFCQEIHSSLLQSQHRRIWVMTVVYLTKDSFLLQDHAFCVGLGLVLDLCDFCLRMTGIKPIGYSE